jgi:hypothetical protein
MKEIIIDFEDRGNDARFTVDAETGSIQYKTQDTGYRVKQLQRTGTWAGWILLDQHDNTLSFHGTKQAAIDAAPCWYW